MTKNITIGAFILALSFVGYTQAVHSGRPIKKSDTTDTNPEPSGGGGGAIMVHNGNVRSGDIWLLRSPHNSGVYRIPRDGTIQNMRILTGPQSDWGTPCYGPTVVTLLVNDRPTSASTTFTSGRNRGIDVSGTVDVFDGDRISVEVDTRENSEDCTYSAPVLMSVSYEIL